MDAKNIARSALDVISSLLGPKAASPDNKRTIADITLDDLRREKIRLDQEERKMLARLREVEADKRKLFEEGVKNASEREQRVLARKIKELDVEAKNMDRNLEYFSKQLRIINGFIQLKDNQRLLAEAGISSIISGIDLLDLQKYVDKATVDGEFHMDKFKEVLTTLEESGNVAGTIREDDDVMAIVRAMQQAQEAANPAQAIDEEYTRVDTQLNAAAREVPEEE
jgi:hypothetical protein